MPAKIDLCGMRFGRLTVVELVITKRSNGSPRRSWRCLCNCGSETITTSHALKAGRSNSCGCFHIEAITKHGHSPFRPSDRSPTYKSWTSMISRCRNPNATGYTFYGGRGIKVCERWFSFENFLADMGERPTNTTLDRKDPDGDYEPGNCRWATKREQQNNQRCNRRITIAGRTMNVVEWCRELNVSEELVRSRLKLGWSPLKALTYERMTRERDPTTGRYR